jgi:hypothetical protein
MQSVKPWVTGAAFAVVIAAVYVACAVAVAVVLFPDGALLFLNTWAHGIDLSLIKRPAAHALTPLDWAAGFATAVIAGFLAGALFGWARNAFARLSAQTA